MVSRRSPHLVLILSASFCSAHTVSASPYFVQTVSAGFYSVHIVSASSCSVHIVHICFLYSPGPVSVVLGHKMEILLNPLINGLFWHTSKMIFFFFEKCHVIP